MEQLVEKPGIIPQGWLALLVDRLGSECNYPSLIIQNPLKATTNDVNTTKWNKDNNTVLTTNQYGRQCIL